MPRKKDVAVEKMGELGFAVFLLEGFPSRNFGGDS